MRAYHFLGSVLQNQTTVFLSFDQVSITLIFQFYSPFPHHWSQFPHFFSYEFLSFIMYPSAKLCGYILFKRNTVIQDRDLFSFLTLWSGISIVSGHAPLTQMVTVSCTSQRKQPKVVSYHKTPLVNREHEPAKRKWWTAPQGRFLLSHGWSQQTGQQKGWSSFPQTQDAVQATWKQINTLALWIF